MRGLQINVNGFKVFTAVASEAVGAGVHQISAELFYVAATGLKGSEMLIWKSENIRLGDEVTIKVVEVDAGDPPTTRKKIER